MQFSKKTKRKATAAEKQRLFSCFLRAVLLICRLVYVLDLPQLLHCVHYLASTASALFRLASTSAPALPRCHVQPAVVSFLEHGFKIRYTHASGAEK
jgi:hypothetical protein